MADELTLENGAQLHIYNNGRWVQNGAGAIRSGLGAASSVLVDGEFEKQGPGAFTIEPAVTCSGTMLLEGDALAVVGPFRLTETGKRVTLCPEHGGRRDSVFVIPWPFPNFRYAKQVIDQATKDGLDVDDGLRREIEEGGT